MKFEKINDNQMRVIISIQDLEDNDISLHDFMSNSLESQDLFFDLLEEAEEKIGFKTKNCQVRVEALAMTDDNFVLTITKVKPNANKKHTRSSKTKPKPVVKRKTHTLELNHLIYKFNSFDDYCYFVEFLVKSNLVNSVKVAEKIYLYLYKDCLYLVLCNLNTKYKNITKFYTIITEFGSYISNPDIFIHRLNESGTIFIKNNAFKKSFLHYTQKAK